LLMAMPPRSQKRWTESAMDGKNQADYESLLENLFRLEPAKDTHGKYEPRVLTMTRDAKDAWIAFYNQSAREQAAADGEFASMLAKLETYAARFALLHHVVGHVHRQEDDRQNIAIDSVKAGIALSRWFATESRRIYSMLGGSGDQRKKGELIEFIE